MINYNSFLHKLNEVKDENNLKTSLRTSISKEEFLKLYRENCSFFMSLDFDNASLIYRGFDSSGENTDYYYLDPKKHKRVPKGSNRNLINCMTSNSPSWDHFPNRYESVIGATDSSVAALYGNVYVVIPYDDALIGVCSKNDFIISFNKTLSKIPISDTYEFEDMFLNFYNQTMKKYPDTLSCQSLLSDIDLIDELKEDINSKIEKIKLFSFKRIFKEYYNSTKSSKQKFRDYLVSEFFDPGKNDFKILSLNKKGYSIPKKREVWIDSECLFIRYELFMSMKDELKVI